ncbi:ribose ABC transporter [Agrobacterium vitis]|uniref:RbsD/FucU family protein n=1 Tax=Rhizobium/Agrobacterium group TaxID=227290 RepID=UPI0012E85AD0|nr:MULTISPECIES: RbsD/FucU domain-containing protein [Rhizobium/Agrobacterium group]MCF1494294.1 ribose ABC transporter [Allorhizobium ampelinum]MVA47801.1 ribose ABC transporter [Agrobacterium vitis]
MLKTINPLLTGDLLAILADMGHGDEIVIADANFPAVTAANRLVQMPGIDACAVLEAIISLMPLDDFVEYPASVMDAPGERPSIYAEFDALIERAENRKIELDLIDRFAFYDRSKAAFAVVSTGERRLYGNIILKKGVVRPA